MCKSVMGTSGVTEKGARAGVLAWEGGFLGSETSIGEETGKESPEKRGAERCHGTGREGMRGGTSTLASHVYDIIMYASHHMYICMHKSASVYRIQCLWASTSF